MTRAVMAWVLASVGLWGSCVGAQVPGSAAHGGVAMPQVQAALPNAGAAVVAHPDAPMSVAVKARWDHIAAELRCLVCQNESLASSNAELAVDLRREVRSLIEQGQSYKPEVKPVTWLLWFGPFALLLGALAVAWRWMRRTPAAPEPLTDTERERVRQLLES